MTAEEAAASIISRVGLWWPLAEQDQLRLAAGAYERVASAALAAAANGSAGARLVTESNRGEAISAFSEHWASYDGTYSAGLPATAAAAAQVSGALREFADAVENAKRQIINLAIEIGASIAVGAALALFTFGTSAGAAAARVAMVVARRAAVAAGLTGVAQTIVATLLVGAAFGSVEGFLSSIVAQVTQQVLSDGPGISVGETMSWTAVGAATGLVGAGAGMGASLAARALRNSDNVALTRLRSLDRADDGFINLARLIGRGRGAAPAAPAVNRAGRAYPDVIDPRTGSPIPFPGAGIERVAVSQRVTWTARERGSYIKEWYDRGYPTPEGGWASYDIHHIRPREYGGGNDFSNLVPVARTVHQDEFNAWWWDY